MVDRIVLALIRPPALTSRADAQPALATQMESPPTAAIPRAPPPMPEPREPASLPDSSRGHGWQIRISDVAVCSSAARILKPGVSYGWVGGPAIRYFGHGDVGRGLASPVLRAGLPLVGL